MIGIIGAMDVEVDTLKALVENKKTETVSGVEFVTGDLHGQKAVIAKCGIGKVFASLCAQTMIMKYNPECIINVGVGGALSPLLDCADIAVAEIQVFFADLFRFVQDTVPVHVREANGRAHLFRNALDSFGIVCRPRILKEGIPHFFQLFRRVQKILFRRNQIPDGV